MMGVDMIELKMTTINKRGREIVERYVRITEKQQ